MPATTPVLGIPYPLPADPVADYPGVGLNLANVLEALGLAGVRKFWDSLEAGIAFPVSSIVPPTIPQTAKALLIAWRARSNYGGSGDSLAIRWNGGVAAAYNTQKVSGSAAAASAAERLGSTLGVEVGDLPVASAGAPNAGVGAVLIPDYTSLAGNPFYRSLVALYGQTIGVLTGQMRAGVAFGYYGAGGPLTSLEFRTLNSAGLVAGTRLTVYLVG